MLVFFAIRQVEGYLGYAISIKVTQKKCKYQTCQEFFSAYNAENRSVCQRSGFFVPEDRDSTSAKVKSR